ncbi:CsbD family protein [Leptothermofonsia sichuanensis E412]|uniref:CsbD family protein n=1 Tax=Leptothermofonsia sichuanensis TaxID=2917832 RepID=UPI001CA6373E|nr:CsbD family protein [Leptothermofonsia sichuanensis]QZZ22056.1 CsbD family protein [Leptothermofonsia sichuanensis E412]
MSLEERAKATAKNVEGKVQEAIGNITGDPKDQIEGKLKQAEASARHGKEDIKDDVQRNIDRA